MFNGLYRTLFALALIFHAAAGKTLTDSYLGYSIVLPNTWIRETTEATHHQFYDTSGTNLSMVAIVRYDFSSDTIFSAPEEWTRANFIAYTLSVFADPFCNLVFYDTVTVKQDGVLWATDALTEFYSYDSTIGDWAEFVRYTASGKYGYELYVLGPLHDVDSNIGMYASIIDSITLPIANASVFPQKNSAVTVGLSATAPQRYWDALGRRLRSTGTYDASKMVFSRLGSSCSLKNTGFPHQKNSSGKLQLYRSKP